MTAMKVIKIHAPEDRRFGHTTATMWSACYSILAETADSKYILIDFADGIDVVVSKFDLPFAGGIRYFVSVPEISLAIPMRCSLLDTGPITVALKGTHGTLSTEKAITVAHVLQDLGDF